jgi:hypothetical protein
MIPKRVRSKPVGILYIALIDKVYPIWSWNVGKIANPNAEKARDAGKRAGLNSRQSAGILFNIRQSNRSIPILNRNVSFAMYYLEYVS